MNSHAHVILELPAPKEVSMIWDLNLSASFSSQHVSPGVGIVSRPPIRRLIDVVPVLFSLHRLAAPLYRYIALALHSSPCPSRERKRERFEDMKIQILSHAGYESSLIFNKFQWFGGSIPNEFRGTFLQRESKHTEALIGRHPIGHL